MGGKFKASFWMSIIGHCALFVLVLSYAIFSDLFKEEPQKSEPFTLLPAPSETAAPTPPQPEQPAPSVEEVKIRQFKPLKEIELPPELPPEPDPSPAQQPTPAPKPQPKPEKPKPQTFKESDKAKPTPPKRVSAEDFFKNRKPPKNAKPSKLKPVKPDLSPVKTTQTLSNLPSASASAAASAEEEGSYEREVYELLRRHWVPPEACAGMDLSVAVSFTINAGGKAVDFKILKSSGEKVFDASVEKVLKSLTFRSPPRGKPMTLRINFRAEDKF